MFVRALKGKQLDLSTPNLVHIYFIVVAPHALTKRSKGQKVKVTRLRKLSQSHVLLVTHAATAVCCCCRRESACRYDCLCFLVSLFFLLNKKAQRHLCPRLVVT